MLIALLAVLGVDLIVLVVLATFVFARKRWVNRQPGAFRGVMRVAGGEGERL
jgi:threonine/homoserine/homoserine lactone efflux protein